MAPKKNETAAETTDVKELSPEAQAARLAVATRPRQSVVRFVEYFRTIREAAPDELDRLFGGQIDELDAVADKVESPIDRAFEKVKEETVARAIKALENEDELNGYANYVFDADVFAEKTREKQPRVKRTVAEKATDLLAEASDEDLQALKELLAARGL